jgi:hypothetical protein
MVFLRERSAVDLKAVVIGRIANRRRTSTFIVVVDG